MLEKAMDAVLFVGMWVALKRAVFRPPNRGRAGKWGMAVYMACFTAAVFLLRLAPEPAASLLLLLAGCGGAMLYHRHGWRRAIAESAVTYIWAKGLSLLGMAAASAVCFPLLEAGGSSLVNGLMALARGLVCAVIILGCRAIARRKVLFFPAEEHWAALLTVSVAMMALAYGPVTAGAGADRRFAVYSLLNFLCSVVLLSFWAGTVHRMYRERDREEHRRGKVLPAMERAIREMELRMEGRGCPEGLEEELRDAGRAVETLGREEGAREERAFHARLPLPPTGSWALDQQLRREKARAGERGVLFDAAVHTPVPALFRSEGISHSELLRLTGDLARNAAESAARGEEGRRRVLLVLGRTEQGYRIDVHDSGPYFAPHVLARLGRRGVTTGGTGNGLADLMELLEKYGFSFAITEHRPECSGMTKCVSVLFDGRGRVDIAPMVGKEDDGVCEKI